MREHEVPTHVQAEDKVLLWFTFPQIVAVVAVCALAYGAYRYFPLGPAEFRLGIAILLGIVGIAMTVGKVGGRGLPLVAADLLKFNLGAGRYAGSPAQLALSEPPAPEEAKPDPLRLLAKKAAGGVGRAVDAARKKGRAPFRPHSWFGKHRRPKDGDNQQFKPEETKHKKPWGRFLAVAALGLLAVVLLPSAVLADDPDDEGPGWRLDEIYFVPPDPVPGRRIFVEQLAVSGDTAAVTLRAAHDLDLKVRVYGGRAGKTLRMGANTSLTAGQARSYNLTLNGPSPSFTFSWVDALGRSGAVSVKSHQIPYPLPQAYGGLCDLELTSLEWTPGQITGVIASECIADTRQEVALPVYGGHFSQSVPALLDASVTRIAGRVNVVAGSHRASAPFVAGGQTRFTLPVSNRKLGFTHFKRRRRGNPQAGGTGRLGVPAYRGWLRTVKNLRTPATGGAAPGRWRPRRWATACRTRPPGVGSWGAVFATRGRPRWSRRRAPAGRGWCGRWPGRTTGVGSPRPSGSAPPER